MAYVPQFIPTNTQALQGTLNQYQEASDRNTGVLNQANDLYSALPTTNPYDTSKKNEIMGKFQKDVIAGLDKKYNFDRSNSQYAKELASEIGKLRSDPLWTLVKERDQVDTIRQQLIAQRGADYHENINPDKITDVNQLKDGKPMDLKDLDKGMMMAAMAKTQTMLPKTSWKDTGKGYWEVKQVQGFESRDEAANYLTNNEEGKALVQQTATSLGFDPSDPKIYARAFTAAMDKLIGEAKYSTETNYDYIEGLRNRADREARSNGNTIISNTGNPNPPPFAIEKISDAKKLEANDAALRERMPFATPEEQADIKSQLDKNQIERSKVMGVQNSVFNTPAGKKVNDTGLGIIKEYFPGLASDDLNSMNETFRDYMFDKSAAGRNNAIAPLAHGLARVFGKPLGVIGAILGSSNIQGLAIANAAEVIKKKVPKAKDETKIGFASNIANEYIKKNADNGKYGDVTNMKDGSPEMNNALKLINADWKRSLPRIYEAVETYESFYKGKDKYASNNLSSVEKQIDKRLAEGQNNKFLESAPAFDMKKADYDNFVSNVSSIMDRLIPMEAEYKRGDGQMWNEKKYAELKQDIAKGADIRILTNGDDPMMLAIITESGENRVTLQLDEKQSGYDLLDVIYRASLQDPNVLNQYYRSFELAPNKKYTIQDALPKMPSFLGIQDDIGIEDVSMRQTEKNNTTIYELYLSKDDQEPDEFSSRKDMLNALKMYKDKVNSQTNR